MEREPNDDPMEFQVLGQLQQGECFEVMGFIGPQNDQDTYRIILSEPQALKVFLGHRADVNFDLEVMSGRETSIVTTCEASETLVDCEVQFTDSNDELILTVFSVNGEDDYRLLIFSL